MNRTDRLYAIVEELRAAAPQWRSASSLAEHFEVSTRTIERDLSALQQSGVPIYATPGRRGGYALDLQHTLPPLNLSAAEVAAVATALATSTSTPFTHAGRTALQKILAVLREVDAESTRELATRIRLFDDGNDAACRRRACDRRGTGPRDPVHRQDRRVHRSHDRAGRGARCATPLVCVWGWCRLREAPRAFRLDRIRSATILDERVPDRGLDPADVAMPTLIGRGILGERDRITPATGFRRSSETPT